MILARVVRGGQLTPRVSIAAAASSAPGADDSHAVPRELAVHGVDANERFRCEWHLSRPSSVPPSTPTTAALYLNLVYPTFSF